MADIGLGTLQPQLVALALGIRVALFPQAFGNLELHSSPWMAPAVFVPKKSGELRLCIDYHELNKKTTKDAYPLPLPDEVQDRFSGSTIFSTLDLQSGYWQLPVSPTDREKTAFCPGQRMEHTPIATVPTVVGPAKGCGWCSLSNIHTNATGRRENCPDPPKVSGLSKLWYFAKFDWWLTAHCEVVDEIEALTNLPGF